MNALPEKIRISLVKNDNDANRRKWAAYIVKHKIPLKELLPILKANDKAALRFIWMVGGMCELDPAYVFPMIPKFFSLRKSINVLNYSRSLARMMWRCGVPPKIEGDAADALFQWLTDPQESVSIKVYSMYALFDLTKKHPGLKNELRFAIESQLNHFSPAFDRSAKKLIGKIGTVKLEEGKF